MTLLKKVLRDPRVRQALVVLAAAVVRAIKKKKKP